MTKKQINNLSLSDAIKILTKNNVKILLTMPDSDIRAKARHILKTNK